MLPSPKNPLAALSPKAVGVLAAVVTVVIWTSFIVIARASADPARGGVLNPFDIVYARIVGASLILAPWGWWLVRRDRATQPWAGSLLGLSPLPLRQTLAAGFFGGLLYAMLAYSGFVYAPAGHASVLMPGSLPLWTALLAMAFLGERITLARAIGLALIVVGDLLVGGTSLLHALDGSGVWRGDVLFILAAMVWSAYSVLVRKWALHAVRATIAITMLALLTYVPVYTALLLLQWVPGQVLVAPWRDVVFQMFFQGIGSVVVSGMTFTKMIQHFGPVRSTMITALVPGLSAISAVMFLGEPLGWNVLAGLTLVTLGIVFGVWRAAKVASPSTTNTIAVHAINTRPAGRFD
ncbi:MAG TPA: DMT family transporter [Rhodoferax sp.]|nr:DMT family transporter [Rhodoferax sp.]